MQPIRYFGRSNDVEAQQIRNYLIASARDEARAEQWRHESAVYTESMLIASVAFLVVMAIAACVVYFKRFDSLTPKGRA